jgi:hypothetical protein
VEHKAHPKGPTNSDRKAPLKPIIRLPSFLREKNKRIRIGHDFCAKYKEKGDQFRQICTAKVEMLVRLRPHVLAVTPFSCPYILGNQHGFWINAPDLSRRPCISGPHTKGPVLAMAHA